MCEQVGYPTAPEDWYADSPLYVGNEMPIEEVQAFASSLEGYENYWIDRAHKGWVTMGFVDADVATHQAALEEEFPDIGVVAVEMPYTYEELDRIRRRIAEALPEDMDASNMYEARGVVSVWVGRLTPERIAVAEGIVGEAPACLEGTDPDTTPEPGPQPAGGKGWAYLASVDSTVGDWPMIITDGVFLEEVWDELAADGTPPQVDFDRHIVVGFPLVYSGSCPETRFDDVVVDGDLVHPIISHISTEWACTADANLRTYVVAIRRDILPVSPFRISSEKGAFLEVHVTADLRQPGRVPAPEEIEENTTEPPPAATPTPTLVETGYPGAFTLDVSCGIGYLGAINWVGWHIAVDTGGLPVEWEGATVDGLLDLEILITEGPEPTLTATAGGHDILYLPGSDEEDPCLRNP